MKQQSFAAVEESEAKKIVVDERRQRTHDDVDHAELGFSLHHDHLRAQRRVTVHVFDVVGERGVRVVEQRARLDLSGRSVHLDVFVDRAILELPSPTSEESQLWIRPEPAVPDPATEEFILSGYPQTVEVSMRNSAGLRLGIDSGERVITCLLAESR